MFVYNYASAFSFRLLILMLLLLQNIPRVYLRLGGGRCSKMLKPLVVVTPSGTNRFGVYKAYQFIDV